MRKVIRSVMCFILIVFCLAGCSKACDYPFLHPAEEIVDMRIGVVYWDSGTGELLADGVRELETIAVLSSDQQEVLLDRFDSIECWEVPTHPLPLGYGETVIYIAYKNGDFELIDSYGQGTYGASSFGMNFLNDDTKYYDCESYYGLDPAAFDSLIDQTLKEIEEAG